jgi:hypothetical protein
VESFIPEATCAAVTIIVGDWNHAVPCIPTKSGWAFRSASSKYRVIPTVECASCARSTHPVSARDCAESNRRKISAEQVRPRMTALSKMEERQNH